MQFTLLIYFMRNGFLPYGLRLKRAARFFFYSYEIIQIFFSILSMSYKHNCLSHLLLWSYGIVFISPIDSTLNVAYTFCGSRSTCYFLNILTTSSGTLLPGMAFSSRYFAYPLRSKLRLSCFLYGSTLSIKSSITFCFSLNDIVCPLI